MAPSARFQTDPPCSPCVRHPGDGVRPCLGACFSAGADLPWAPGAGPRGARRGGELLEVPRRGPGTVAGQVPDLPQTSGRPHRAEVRRASRGRRRLQCVPRGAPRRRCRAQAHRHATLQPRGRNRIRAREQAREAGRELCVLPQEAVVPGRAVGMQLLPQGRAQGCAGHRVHEVPLDASGVQGRAPRLQSRPRRVPADGLAPAGAVRKMPRLGRLPRPQIRHVLVVPQDAAPQRAGAIVHLVPHHRHVEDALDRAWQNRVCPGGRPPAACLRDVPPVGREGRASLRHVLGLPRGRASRQREGRLPHVPHRGELHGREVRSRGAREVPARLAGTSRSRAGSVTRVSRPRTCLLRAR